MYARKQHDEIVLKKYYPVTCLDELKWQDKKGIEFNAEIQARSMLKVGFVIKERQQVQDTLQTVGALVR